MRLWAPSFAPYSRDVWVYALAMGLHGTIEIVGSVRLARSEYGFLWFVALPTTAMCGGLYMMRHSVDLSLVVLLLVATRALILFMMLAHSMLFSRKAENG